MRDSEQYTGRRGRLRAGSPAAPSSPLTDGTGSMGKQNDEQGGRWQDEKEDAVRIVCWRTGRWHKEAKELLNARLGPAVRGDVMSVGAKLERLADVLAEILDEQGGAFVASTMPAQIERRAA